jgi:hypothetical protein
VAGSSPSGEDEDASMLMSTGAALQSSMLFAVAVATSMVLLVVF